MLNYELAKKLKDAGFPQIGNQYSYYGYGSVGGVGAPYMNLFQIRLFQESNPDIKLDLVRIPTLEELIEACGEGVFALKRHTLGWNAGISDGVDYKNSNVGKVYPTAIEAVANLYLVLHE